MAKTAAFLVIDLLAFLMAVRKYGSVKRMKRGYTNMERRIAEMRRNISRT